MLGAKGNQSADWPVLSPLAPIASARYCAGEAVAAKGEALKERTREHVPFESAACTGHRGVALILLADARGDTEMANLAARQIKATFTTSRDGGDAPSAAYIEAQLPKARARAEILGKR